MKYNMKIYTRQENCSSLVAKICNKEIWHAHLISKDRAKDLRLRKNSNSCAKKHQCHYEDTSDLVKLKNNYGLTAKTLENQLSLSSKPVLCMVMTFLGHANQEAHSIRKTNIAMLLTKDLYPLAKYVTILSE